MHNEENGPLPDAKDRFLIKNYHHSPCKDDLVRADIVVAG
jgi:hypothetical protein